MRQDRLIRVNRSLPELCRTASLGNRGQAPEIWPPALELADKSRRAIRLLALWAGGRLDKTAEAVLEAACAGWLQCPDFGAAERLISPRSNR